MCAQCNEVCKQYKESVVITCPQFKSVTHKNTVSDIPYKHKESPQIGLSTPKQTSAPSAIPTTTNTSVWDISLEDWNDLCNKVFKRDKYKCQACDKRFAKRKLSGHHIRSRKDGGSDDMRNLTTLCHPCHDMVEYLEIESLNEIRSMRKDNIRAIQKVVYLKD